MKHIHSLLLILMLSLWGANWTAMKAGLAFVSPITFTLHRFAIAALTLSPMLFLIRAKVPRDHNKIVKLLIYSMIYLLQVLTTQIGLVREDSGVGAVLTFTQPIFVFCLAVWILHEKASLNRVLGIVMGFSGVLILIIRSLSEFTLQSAFMMILGGLFWAAAIVFFKRFLSDIEPVIPVFFQLFLGSILLLVLSLATNAFVFSMERAYLSLTLYSSIGSLVVGTIIWLFLLKEGTATILSGYTFIVPVLALLFGWLFLGERFTVESIVGSVLVLGGIYAVNRRPKARDVDDATAQ